MTSIIRSRIKDRGGNDKAVAEVLYALVEGDDNFEEYMEAVGTVEETEDNSANAFETLFNETNPDEDIITDLKNTFDELVTSDSNEAETENGNPGF